MGGVAPIIVAFVFGSIASVFIQDYFTKQIDSEYFHQFDDSCNGVSAQQNHSYFTLGLQSLAKLGTVVPPNVEETDESSISSLDKPETWTEPGDGIYSVDGSWWYVSVATPMPGVTGDMIKRWFSYADCSTKYTWWHPRDHFFGIWRTAPAGPASHPAVARHGQVHRVIEKVGGRKNRLDITFVDPCKHADCSGLKGQEVTAVLSARILSYIPGLGLIDAGRFVHTFAKTNGMPTLHSKFWLAKDPRCVVSEPKGVSDSFCESVVPLAKYFMATESLGQGVYTHCKEEMYTLSRLLKRLKFDRKIN